MNLIVFAVALWNVERWALHLVCGQSERDVVLLQRQLVPGDPAAAEHWSGIRVFAVLRARWIGLQQVFAERAGKNDSEWRAERAGGLGQRFEEDVRHFVNIDLIKRVYHITINIIIAIHGRVMWSNNRGLLYDIQEGTRRKGSKSTLTFDSICCSYLILLNNFILHLHIINTYTYYLQSGAVIWLQCY